MTWITENWHRNLFNNLFFCRQLVLLTTGLSFGSGIFSDTHLLTMMYIGEMCFWAVKYEDCSADTTEHKEDRLQFRDIGTQILNKYVLACEGPLQGQGWNTENAKEILSILQWKI